MLADRMLDFVLDAQQLLRDGYYSESDDRDAIVALIETVLAFGIYLSNSPDFRIKGFKPPTEPDLVITFSIYRTPFVDMREERMGAIHSKVEATVLRVPRERLLIDKNRVVESRRPDDKPQP